MGRRVKVFALRFVTFGIALLLASCDKAEPTIIGFVGGLTGRTADLGVAGRNGAMLAIEQRNAAGGIHGRPVELVVRDDEQNRETARRVVSELIGGNVAAIIGPMTSSMAMAAVPVVNTSKVVIIGPTVTTNDLSARDDNFFRVTSSTSEYAAKNARFQFGKRGCRTAAAIYDLNNNSYTESWLHDFGATFESLGGRMVKVVSFRSGNDAVFFEKVRELLAANPDIVMVITNAVDAALICQQIRKLDGRVQLGLSEWAATERLIELGGAAVEGIHVDQYFDRDDRSERFATFLKNYRERYGLEPGFAGVAAYDAANVVLDALAGKGAGQTLRDYILAKGTFQGIQQTIAFDRFGDARRKTYVSTVRNGKFVTVE